MDWIAEGMGETPSRADVVIVGAGIIGLSTAYYLRRMSDATVVVLDRGPIGGVASPRAAGSLRHHYSHPLLVEMAVKSHSIFREFADASSIDFGYVRNGYLLGVAEDDAEWLADNVNMVKSIGVDTGLIPLSKISSLHPYLEPKNWTGAIAYDRDSAHVQPPDFMRALTAAVADQGAVLLPGTAVEAIDTSNGAVGGVVTRDEHRIESSVVLNAAGAWAGSVASLAGTTIPVSVGRLLQIFELTPPFSIPVATPTLSDGPLDLYTRVNPSNRLLVGARHYFDTPMNPDDVPLYPVHETVLDTRQRFERIVPDSKGLPVYRAWAGIDGDTPDYQPVIGEIDGISGLFVAAGFSGHGFKLGPVVGQGLAELIHGGQSTTFDIGMFDPKRFDRGELFPIGYKQMGA